MLGNNDVFPDYAVRLNDTSMFARQAAVHPLAPPRTPSQDVSTIAPFGEEQLAQVAPPAEPIYPPTGLPPTPYERVLASISPGGVASGKRDAFLEDEGLGVRPAGAPPRRERDVRPDSYVSLDGDNGQHGLNAFAMFENQSRYSENWAPDYTEPARYPSL